MTEEETRNLVKEEMRHILEFFNHTNFNFQKHITILDDKNIQVGRTNGTKIGTATDQKIGFFGHAPVIQQSAITDPSGGATVDAEARAKIIQIRDALKSLGLIA